VLLALKLLLVPGLVAAVTLGVRRWGPTVGGWLATLPVVAGPVLVFYAIEQGDAFAAQAAHATLTGLIATAAFAVAYARCSIRWPWYGSVVAGWTAYGAAVFVLYGLQPALIPSLGLLVVAAVLGRRSLPRLAAATEAATRSHGDLAIRLVATATLVLVLTGLAERLGPTLSGMLNAFPVLTTIVAAFTHAQRGRHGAVAFLNGFFRAIVGFALFCVVMALALVPQGLLVALAAALAVQLAAHGVLLWSSSRCTPAAAS